MTSNTTTLTAAEPTPASSCNASQHATTLANKPQQTTACTAVPSTVVIAGGSGFIGQHLANHLVHTGYHVAILTRQHACIKTPVKNTTPIVMPHITHVHWDGKTPGPWTKALEGAAAVINLAGKNVNCRYTKANRRAILDSRLQSTAALDAAIRQCEQPPPVWVQAATLAIYGHRGDQMLTEADPIGRGFSPDVAKAWEQAVHDAGHVAGQVARPTTESTPEPVIDQTSDHHQTPRHMRKVILRISFVLGNGGGALPTLARLARLGLGGSVGNGNQYYSWIHIDDLCGIIDRSITDQRMEGVYNVTSPQPVRNHEFMRLLRQAVHRPWSPPAPAWAIKIGCFFMRTEAELALRSRYGLPARLQVMGYAFKFTKLQNALNNIYPRQSHHLKPPTLTRHFDI